MKILVPLVAVLLVILGFLMLRPKPEVKFDNIIIGKPLNGDRLFRLVNTWRVESGYPAYYSDERLCTIASDRADDGIDNHEGFIRKIKSNYYGFTEGKSFQENLVSGYSTEEDSLNGWLHSPAHLAALQKDWKYSCVKCKDQSCSQIFSNL